MHLWRGDYGSFIRDAQMEFCQRLIVVPLSTFHRLAEEIGDPQGELIFLFNTSRCGSTLLTQVETALKLLLNFRVFLTEPKSINPSYLTLSVSVTPAKY